MQINKRKVLITSAFIAGGFIAGFSYWHFIGCTSGTCPLTSNWYNSTLIGGVMGYLLSDSFIGKKKTNNQQEVVKPD